MRFALAIACLALVLPAPAAFGWGYATHAFVADELYKQGGARNADEIYAALAPDMFNTAYDYEPLEYEELYALVHYQADRMWDAARTGREKALAFGFHTHSGDGGADQTAHHDGLTYGEGTGHVIQKASDMQAVLRFYELDLMTLLGLDPTYEPVELEVYHSILEYATEVLTVRIDPEIGLKIAEAAAERSRRFPSLFVDAYEVELEAILGEDASERIHATEASFREEMMAYGMLLTFDEETLLTVLTGHIAQYAEAELERLGVELPDGFDPVPLIGAYLDLAMVLCETDYAAELEATTGLVQEELAERGIFGSRDFVRAQR